MRIAPSPESEDEEDGHLYYTEEVPRAKYYGSTMEHDRRPTFLRWDFGGFRLLPIYFLVLTFAYLAYQHSEAHRRHVTVEDEKSALSAFCDGFDASADGASTAADCRAHDYATFCEPHRETPSRRESELSVVLFDADAPCAGTCDGPNSSAVLPCLWQAVARLDDFCDGTFVFEAPDRADDGEAGDPSANRDCARRAVCAACDAGDASCGAVAEFYGEEEKPLFGARAAVGALSDRAFWCGKSR